MEVLVRMRVWSRFLHLSGARGGAKWDPFWEPFPAKNRKMVAKNRCTNRCLKSTGKSCKNYEVDAKMDQELLPKPIFSRKDDFAKTMLLLW